MPQLELPDASQSSFVRSIDITFSTVFFDFNRDSNGYHPLRGFGRVLCAMYNVMLGATTRKRRRQAILCNLRLFDLISEYMKLNVMSIEQFDCRLATIAPAGDR